MQFTSMRDLLISFIKLGKFNFLIIFVKRRVTYGFSIQSYLKVEVFKHKSFLFFIPGKFQACKLFFKKEKEQWTEILFGLYSQP